MKRTFKNLISLTRFYLSLAIAFSSLAGYVIFSGSFSGGAFLCALGVFLLAASAGALNQLQELKRDAMMERTRHRPLPSEAISPLQALMVIIVLFVTGFMVLLLDFGAGAALLGAGNLLWYNLVYTPLKVRSYFAVLAGAVNGAVPPVIGWVAAGGPLTDMKILFIAFFIFLWQVPHFWLLLMMHGDEYEKAGFYSVTSRFPSPVIRSILLVWIAATGVSAIFLPLFHVITAIPLVILIITLSVILIAFFLIYLQTGRDPATVRPLFIVFNIFMVLVFAIILSEGLL